MASYLRTRRSKGALLAAHLGILPYHAFADPGVPLWTGESFLLAISDLHFLLFLSNLLDMSTDMPILCSKVHHHRGHTNHRTQHALRCTRAEFGDRADLRNQ